MDQNNRTGTRTGTQDQAEGTWDEIKGKIKQTWGKLTDDDVASFRGNWDELSGTIQRKYGEAKEKISEQINEFRNKHPDNEQISNRSDRGNQNPIRQ